MELISNLDTFGFTTSTKTKTTRHFETCWHNAPMVLIEDGDDEEVRYKKTTDS